MDMQILAFAALLLVIILAVLVLAILKLPASSSHRPLSRTTKEQGTSAPSSIASLPPASSTDRQRNVHASGDDPHVNRSANQEKGGRHGSEESTFVSTYGQNEQSQGLRSTYEYFPSQPSAPSHSA